MADEKALNVKIDELEMELENKDKELYEALDKIESLEDAVMRLEAMVPDDNGKKGKKKTGDSKIMLELEDREREIRELKDKLGFLRKEKIQLQKEMEQAAKMKAQSGVIRIEEKKTPLDALVNELQGKLNKQRLLITKLKQKSMDADTAELTEKLRVKEEEVESMKRELEDLRERVKDSQANKTASVQAEAGASITKGLTEELQNKLNKAKIQIEGLQKKLDAQDKKGKKGKKVKDDDSAVDELQEKIDELQEDLNNRNIQIEKLKAQILGLKDAPTEEKGAEREPAARGPIGALTEELQNKLNKAKIQIKTLQDKLQSAQAGKAPAGGESTAAIEKELSMQKEMVISLQQDIEVAKSDATQKALKCEELGVQVQLKEQQINALKAQIDTLSSQSQASAAPTEDPNVALRLRELKGFVEELNKQNIQQRLEISELRNI